MEIDNASSRRIGQGRRFVRLEQICVAVLALTLFPVAASASQSVGPPTQTNDQVRDMGLVSPKTGWALVGQQLFWTVDNGDRWKKVTPQTASPLRIDSAFFLNASSGWLVLSQGEPNTQGGIQLSLASTEDAGQSWKLSAIKKAIDADLRNYARGESIFFLDALHGWLMLRLPSSSNFSFGRLLATADGGRSWIELTAPPTAGTIHFQTQTTGWIVNAPDGDELWVSRDGGKSWQEQTVQSPDSCPNCKVLFGLPKFQSAQDGLLPVTLLDRNRSLTATYISSDAGQSWSPRELQEDSGMLFRPVSADVVNSHSIRVSTSPDGKIMTRVATLVNEATVPTGSWQRGDVRRISFIDDTNGWIIYSAGKCLSFKSECSQQSELLSTTDSGKVFRAIAPVRINKSTSTEASDKPHLYREPTGDIGSHNQPSPSQPGNSYGTQVSQGEGFDMKCVAQFPDMQSWWQSTPYSVTGIYIGGENKSCKNNKWLDAQWVGDVTATGWGLMPLWVGPQAPWESKLKRPCYTQCNNCGMMKSDVQEAAKQGKSEADRAITRANSLGIDTSVLYYDMEPYLTKDASCSAPVSAFVNAWVAELHAFGYQAGMYGNATNAVADWTYGGVNNPPDVLWFAVWDDVDSVWDPNVISNNLWVDHQRIHQYCSDPGVPCADHGIPGIDGDVLDGLVVPGQYLAAPTLEAPTDGATNVGTTPTFTWTAVQGASSGYRIVVATDPSVLPIGPDAPSPCTACTIDYPPTGQTLMQTSYTPPSGILQSGQTYYWEVQARGQLFGLWSSQFSFVTTASGLSVSSLTIDPSTVASGGYARLTVTLSGPAPDGGASVSLSSNDNTAFPVPSHLNIQAGQSSGSVEVQAGTVGGNTNVTVTATYDATYQTADVIVLFSGGNINTLPATKVTASSAILNGTVNPQGANGYVFLDYGTDPNNLIYQGCGVNENACPVVPNFKAQPFNYQATVLLSNTTYYFRIVFDDTDNGTYQYGATLQVTTDNPVVTTKAATKVTANSAVLNGTVNPQGANGYVFLDYGTDPNNLIYQGCGVNENACPVVPNFKAQPFNYQATLLLSNTTYYFRIVFDDTDNGTYQYGATLKFKTLP
jgi:photosystem II stability/assembly factor-like uncharacterized protein